MKRIFKFLKALIKYWLYGQEVTYEKFMERNMSCHGCEDREEDRCGKCGCPLHKKTRWTTEECPLKKW